VLCASEVDSLHHSYRIYAHFMHTYFAHFIYAESYVFYDMSRSGRCAARDAQRPRFLNHSSSKPTLHQPFHHNITLTHTPTSHFPTPAFAHLYLSLSLIARANPSTHSSLTPLCIHLRCDTTNSGFGSRSCTLDVCESGLHSSSHSLSLTHHHLLHY
jgi:hypothetical protein